jgi:large subunit ribosomal protein L35
MPKMKTHRGAAKRFRISPRGKIRRRRAFMGHNFGKKSSRRKRRLTAFGEVSQEDAKKIRRLLGE